MIQEMWKQKEQRNLAPLSVPGASSAGSIRVVSGSGFRYVVPFPYRLHEMLSNEDNKHDSSIVSWLQDGKHFKVHDPRKFVECVIPSAFKQKSLKSFQRQLHLYGFQRVHEGVDKGAYYHEKFCQDDRDLCLTITRTKAPKRNRATPTIRKINDFSQKIPSFHPKKKFMNTKVSAINNSGPIPYTDISGVTTSPQIFEDVSLFNQSSLINGKNFSYNLPLHKVIVPSTSALDGPTSLSKPDQESSSSTAHQDVMQRASLAQQLKAQTPLESSIADTCQWLLNAGVPISAFDPVAIGDISHSTFSTPLLVPSTTSFSPVIPQPTISHTMPQNLCSSNERIETQPLQFNNGISPTACMASLLDVGSASNKCVPLSSTFPDNVSPFDDVTLPTDLFPGENLPMVDDSLWAL